MSSCNKSDLIRCLGSPSSDDPPSCDAKLYDISLDKGDAYTFKDYADNVFMPWILKQLDNHKRIDIVWDSYKPNSLKETTQGKRGTGFTRKVSLHTKLPINFAGFLRDPHNKEEIFEFLSDCVDLYPDYADRQVYITKGQSVINKGLGDTMDISDNEEANTRICLHVLDAINHGSKRK